MEELISRIENESSFNFNETFAIYRKCSEFIINDQHLAQKIIIHILDNRQKFDESLSEILTDLIEAIGFYPYLVKENLNLDSTSSKIRQVYHHSENLNKYLHEDQKYLLTLLDSDKNVIVSAPTSFGKSLLIEEIVASKKFENIVIIQPTLALLDETRRKLKKYESYRIIVRTSQEYSIEKGNIFLFTAERVNEYREFPNIDFIIIDEFYKLSANRDDERADSLNNALHYILKTFNSKFYLLGPNIDGISDGFTEKYNAIFYRTKSSLVDVNTIDIYSEHKEKFDKPRKFKEYKEEVLFNLLYNNKDEQSIIYCSSPSRVRYLSTKFCKFLVDKVKENNILNDLNIIEWIEENVSKNWSVIELLKNRIGIHDGALQKHITTSIIQYFNQGLLNYLFCTTTIIEGVNTSAKNIVFFDKTKGRNTPIDFFDYSNIKGRAGRLMIHYLGNIYNFNPVPSNTQIIIDIPFYEQDPVSDEILINLDDDEVRNKDSEQYINLKKIPEDEKRIIQNNGVQVFGQKNIIETLRKDIRSNYELIAWVNYPTYNQLYYTLKLGWDNLIKPTESVRPMTLKALVTVTQQYSISSNIGTLVTNTYNYFKTLKRFENKSNNEIMDEAIRQSFQTLKHWFEYKVPKWLSVINSIQEFVCHENGLRAGNYRHFSHGIENDFLRENLAILSEFGVPSSAIRKLEKIISPNLSDDEVINLIRQKKILNNKIFLNYERKKLDDA